MSSGDHARARLALRLAGLLAEGIEVSKETVGFAETTYGFDQVACKEVLSGAGSDEQETLQRLIFHPDRQLRLQLEPLLCQQPLSRAQAVMLKDELAERLSSVNLVFPDRSRMPVPVGPETWGFFVDKLYLSMVQEQEIVAAVYDALPHHQALETLVEIRRKRLTLTPAEKKLLISFLDNLKHSGREPMELVVLLLDIWSRVPAGQDPEEFLLEEYRRQRQCLEEIGEFARRCDRFGFEYLLMQRYRVPPESAEEVQKRLGLLEVIIGEILQLENPAGRSARSADLGYFDSEGDLRNLFRVLG